ncbi:MAG: Trm112 family protein [Calditrichaeota bacterium]|nr:MAG: Trm112 family protein [Calditrichota bacterium]
MFDSSKLEYLACPKCRGKLEYHEDPERSTEYLLCRHCQLIYNIHSGIPHLSIDAAQDMQQFINNSEAENNTSGD